MNQSMGRSRSCVYRIKNIKITLKNIRDIIDCTVCEVELWLILGPPVDGEIIYCLYIRRGVKVQLITDISSVRFLFLCQSF